MYMQYWKGQSQSFVVVHGGCFNEAWVHEAKREERYSISCGDREAGGGGFILINLYFLSALYREIAYPWYNMIPSALLKCVIFTFYKIKSSVVRCTIFYAIFFGMKYAIKYEKIFSPDYACRTYMCAV